MKPHRAWISFALALAASTAAPALAQSKLDNLRALSQNEFHSLAEDLGAALSYKPLAPATPLGFPGFEVGVGVTGTKLKHQDLFVRASNDGDFPSTLVVPTVRAAVGLPWDFTASGTYSSVPKTGMKLYGAALSYAFVPGNTLLPALGVRASYTKMNGVDQLDFDTAGIDGSISKGIAFVTPYIGGGRIWANAAPSSATPLRAESFWLNKVYGGLDFKLTIVHLAFEYDRTGEANSYGVKLSLSF